MKAGRGVRRWCCLSPVPFNFYSDYNNKETLQGFVDFKPGWHVLRTVQYAGDVVLLGKEEAVLRSMTDRQVEAGRQYGIEMSVVKLR